MEKKSTRIKALASTRVDYPKIRAFVRKNSSIGSPMTHIIVTKGYF